MTELFSFTTSFETMTQIVHSKNETVHTKINSSIRKNKSRVRCKFNLRTKKNKKFTGQLSNHNLRTAKMMQVWQCSNVKNWEIPVFFQDYFKTSFIIWLKLPSTRFRKLLESRLKRLNLKSLMFRSETNKRTRRSFIIFFTTTSLTSFVAHKESTSQNRLTSTWL